MPSPRANKSLCDDVREIKWGEARELFKSGIRRGMVSFFDSDTIPKYVWAVDEQNEVYEAKTKPERENYYHGYRLGKNDRFRVHVLDMWKHR